MAARHWLTWLHRIGYLATAIVAAELVAIGWVAGDDWWQMRQVRARLRQETFYGPGLLHDESIVGYLAVLPRREVLGQDGFRFVADPALSNHKYGVAVRLLPGRTWANGVLARMDTDDRGGLRLTQHAFRLSRASYVRLTAEMDRRLDGFEGSSDLFLDGTTLAIERVRGRTITSGRANLVGPYRAVSGAVLAATRSALPGERLPLREGWYSDER